MRQRYDLLIVDDEPANLQKLKRTFVNDFRVYEASGGAEALEQLKVTPVAVIITDQRMPGMNGVELLRRSLEVSPGSVRIILTGYTEVEDLMDAINQGHVHRYVTKPWEPSALREMVKRELRRWELEQENDRLAEELRLANEKLSSENVKLKQEVEFLREGEKELIYKSQAMGDLLDMLSRVVKTDSTILIQGETGTGKELLARYAHTSSHRAAKAFVPVNTGAIPRDLVESSFFGHRKGAFTGASQNRRGFFEMADGGTLFLDEVGEAPLDLQVKLLWVLQEGEILPVGEERPRKVDVRVIASTNRNLSQIVEEGGFRQDLFFRLNVFSLYVPPLRARKEDIAILVDHFLRRACSRLNKQVVGFESAALERLMAYEWPGNVRELENEIERVVILSDQSEEISSNFLSDRIRFGSPRTAERGNLKEQVATLERQLILRALRLHRNNRTRAAEHLGITRQTIISKLKTYENRQS